MPRGKVPDPRAGRRGTRTRPPAGERVPATINAPPVPAELAAAAPPATLGEAGANAWRVALAELASNRQLREVDLVLLRTWSEAVQIHAAASDELPTSSLLVMGVNGSPIANPLVRIQRDAATTIRQVAGELGLSPLARLRAGVIELAGQSLLFGLRDRLLEKAHKGRE